MIEPLTKAQKVGIAGFFICIASFICLVAAAIWAAVGSAVDMTGWPKTACIMLAVSTIPWMGVGLFMLGHPPGEGPKFMRGQQ